MTSSRVHPIIIVTGANSGLGLAVCERLLHQLCFDQPPDALPQPFHNPSNDDEWSNIDEITLIIVCRSIKNANNAKKEIFASLDKHVQKLDTERARKFRENVTIDALQVDLANLDTVFQFAETVNSRYPYISHFVANAGFAPFIGFNYFILFWQLITDYIGALTTPRYGLFTVGERSFDGLGHVWQCNVFSHYVLFRLLENKLASPAYPRPGRFIWTSSLEAYPWFFNMDDYQILKDQQPYCTSKYQVDLVACELERRSLIAARNGTSSQTQVRHYISEPGVFYSKISAGISGPLLKVFHIGAYYLARLLGSQHHPITAYVAAIAAVHLCLAPLAYLVPSSSATSSHSKSSTANGNDVRSNGHSSMERPNSEPKAALHSAPFRYGACLSLRQQNYVGLTPVIDWEEHQTDAAKLVAKMENIYDKFLADWDRRKRQANGSQPLEVETFDPAALAKST
ncbi:3-keto sterol reductase [Flagelloscypha sp. PMI_526]|nr:3-keto sterol reductase [Flagelloscypha sp. PMI_526]